MNISMDDLETSTIIIVRYVHSSRAVEEVREHPGIIAMLVAFGHDNASSVQLCMQNTGL